MLAQKGLQHLAPGRRQPLCPRFAQGLRMAQRGRAAAAMIMIRLGKYRLRHFWVPLSPSLKMDALTMLHNT
jgi:hypothetical protein